MNKEFILLIILYIIKIKRELKNSNITKLIDNIIDKKFCYIDYNKRKEIIIEHKKIYKQIKSKTIIYKIINSKIIKEYKNINKKIDLLNKLYIEKEISQNEILNDINGYKLDNNQKEAVISDEINTLVIAGAGSGKSLTIIGKVIYLIKTKKVKPKEILCISFTNEATNSLKEKLNKNGCHGIDVFTFHKLALNIIKKNKENITITKEDTLSKIIDKYFEKTIKSNKLMLKEIVCYFTQYIDFCAFNLKDKKEINLNIKIYDKYDYVVAYFLYLNGIKYTYNYLKKYSIFKVKNTQIIVNRTTKSKDNNCIELYEIEFIEGSALKHLKKKLAYKNIKFKPINYEKVYDNLYNYTLYFNQLKKLIITFISLFKANSYDIYKFDDIEKTIKKIKNKIEKMRQKIFIKLVEYIYIEYQYYLSERNEIDFNDMINIATNIIKGNEIKQNYKYIIIDEYQDTSITKFNMINEMRKKCNSKIMAVGDDWQSIYAFSGCTLEMFLNFEKYYGFTKKVIIKNTYRNSKQLIDIAGNFIMKNKLQIKKELTSEKQIDRPINVIKYTNDISEKLEEIIIDITNKNPKPIMILGRNNSDINQIKKSNKFSIKENKIIYLKNKELKIYFMTVHKSKGLEEENVILINAEDKIMGFPNKMMDDPVLRYVKNIKEYYPYEEERRLLYVALTRTKNRIYILVKNKSEFIKEIEKYIK